MNELFEVIEMGKGPQGAELVLWSEELSERQLLRASLAQAADIVLGDRLIARTSGARGITQFFKVSPSGRSRPKELFTASRLTSQFGNFGWQTLADSAEGGGKSGLRTLGDLLVSRKPKSGRVA